MHCPTQADPGLVVSGHDPSIPASDGLDASLLGAMTKPGWSAHRASTLLRLPQSWCKRLHSARAVGREAFPAG